MSIPSVRLHDIFLVILISFVIGCSARVDEDGRIQPTLEATPTNSKSTNVDRDLKVNARLSKDLSNDWNKSQRRLGSDDWIDVCFVDPSFGWIVSIKGDRIVPLGGSIFKTEDGGKIWRKLPLKLPDHSFIPNVSFADRSNGWLVVQTLGRSATRMQILATSDGGESWMPGFSLDDAIASKMTFNGRGEGWIIGIKAKAVYMRDQKNLILYTKDFGRSWVDVTSSSTTMDSGSGQTPVQFEDVLTDILVEDDSSRLTGISRDGKISTTGDQGATWKRVAEAADQEPHSEGFSSVRNLGDGGFLSVSGADGPHGSWSSISAIYADGSRKSSLLARVVITDIEVLDSGDVIVSGLREKDLSETREVVSAVVLSSRDLSDWKVLYEVVGHCKLGCKLNMMSRRGDGYFFVGTDGLLVTMDRN